MNGASVYQMIAGLGDAFSGGYDDARRRAQEDEAPGLLSNLMTAYRGGSPPAPAPTFPAAPAAAAQGGPAASLPSFAQSGGAMGDYLAQTRARESGGNDAAANPNSTALGRYQFTRDTWAGLAKKYPDLGLTPNGRIDPAQQERAMQAFTRDNAETLQGAGLPISPGNLYGAHFLGAGGAARFIPGALNSPDAPATQFVDPSAARANRTVFFNRDGTPKTAAQVYAWMGGQRGPASAAAPTLSVGSAAGADAADLPVAGAKPAAGFAVPEGAASAAPSQGFSGFGAGQPAGSLSPALRDALNAAWRNPQTRSVASQILGQVLKGGDSPWELKDVNGQSAWINGRTGQILPIGQAQRKTATVGNTLVDTSTGEPIFTASPAERDEGAKIRSQVGAREAELRARGLDPSDPAMRRYLLTGTMSEDRPRAQIVQSDDGQRFVVDPDDAAAEPRRLNIPAVGVRVWGSTGPNGEVVQAPPNIRPGTAGYYDPKGVPELVANRGVSVTNTVGAGETEETKALGKLRGERAAAIESLAMKAPDQIGKLNLLGRALEAARTGTLGPAESSAVGFAQALGIPDATIARLGLRPEQAMSAQIATSLTNELVTGMIGAGGFPANNFSDADREFLRDIFPTLSKRPEANQTTIEVLRRVQQRNLEVGDAWQEYQQAQREAGRPGSVAEFEFNFRKGVRGKSDLFADLRRPADAPATPSRPAPGGSPTSPDASGAETSAPPRRAEGGRPPEGYTWESYLARARKTVKDRPDLRPQIEEMLAKSGIPPERLGQ